MVPPIKLKLDKQEAEWLFFYLRTETEGKINRPNVRTELIILAEYYYKTFTKAVNHQIKPGDKPVLYQIPLSVARILHTRLQFYPYSNCLQIILSNLDKQLVDRKMTTYSTNQLSI